MKLRIILSGVFNSSIELRFHGWTSVSDLLVQSLAEIAPLAIKREHVEVLTPLPSHRWCRWRGGCWRWVQPCGSGRRWPDGRASCGGWGASASWRRGGTWCTGTDTPTNASSSRAASDSTGTRRPANPKSISICCSPCSFRLTRKISPKIRGAWITVDTNTGWQCKKKR